MIETEMDILAEQIVKKFREKEYRRWEQEHDDVNICIEVTPSKTKEKDKNDM